MSPDRFLTSLTATVAVGDNDLSSRRSSTMTDTIRRILPSASVQPMVFSHEAAEKPVSRAVTVRQMRRISFSAPATADESWTPR
jgi:hypothetical protein